MIPIGYMAKRVLLRPDWLKTTRVTEIYSVSPCLSPNFADFIPYWQHNGWWFFDSPKIIKDLAQAQAIDLTETTLFYYEAYPLQANTETGVWESFAPEPSFKTELQVPQQKQLRGFDLVSFNCQTSPECSYLSCNQMADQIQVNSFCLLESLESAKNLLKSGAFKNCEPGPCRIFAVYTLPDTFWPG
ncbi:hypothetical protein COW36_05575 [bacterium (Candidatus Blackallbacteria) CG17_big_fil_post_rev_8_21_14_2_50_48_46]|uniref:Uncharacterized protein n=1 Tax=bacterium (Candidatus Blackallbacteria) CG17_big_fil_post_rev_8_21_14_2_50_48_46 TaxID=2014261 RepID=A0A2M7G8A4_9BACT|nr:MAG: hypothetical protein COW64_21170 [bacterium (Candidatus Blackallbacteria) CG18_big_fil_WC_8_21_14_2_50_49_26]PIW18315.1 MAG: hypothetical protein COW36_05575 [bacterium (Candidatus Blackallbacteria) CG17_big_fil_post_rev_8_21_14_2_50_48_46]PIW50692.1 MAG: hypothetical protein COW20_01840 [bacterium (Candidatus Blackallbacteria) CG13_big_fil_rev_8_21_14_2_50_49_14]